MTEGPSYLNLVLRTASQGMSSQPQPRRFTRSQSQRYRTPATAGTSSQEPPPTVASVGVVSAPGPASQPTPHISHTTHISHSPPHTLTHTLAPTTIACEDVGSAPTTILNRSHINISTAVHLRLLGLN